MLDKLLTAKVEDAFRLCRSGPRFIGFLDPAESSELMDYLRNCRMDASVHWFGGYDGAERLVAGFFPDYLEPEEELFPVAAITITYNERFSLSHRDFLGALMSLGVERRLLGDILVEQGRAVIFVKSELQEYFLHGIDKIGQVGVKLAAGKEEPLPSAHVFEPHSGVVASERLDCIVSELTGLSREKSSMFIRSGNVFVNHREKTAVSDKLSEGDVISVRSKGKFVLDQIGPVTKKGRLSIRYRKYR